MNEPSTKRFPWHFAAGAALVCVGLTVASYAVGVGPLLAQHQAGLALGRELDDRGKEAGELAAGVSDLQRDLTAANGELARMPLRLQPASRVNGRLEAVARLATECGLSLDEMRPGGAVDAAHYQTVPLRILGAGDYPACARFLRRLRETFGDMGVRTFTASYRGGGASATATAVFQAELVWFTELPRR